MSSLITKSSTTRGLHDRINRVSHWDVNVTDLERSKAWYEAATDLRAVAETTASQDFPGFHIQGGAFKGYMMRDQTKPAGSPMIHLVEWQSPQPSGKPYLSHTNVGWYRIVPVVRNIQATRQAVINQGSAPFAPTTDRIFQINPDWPTMGYKVFTTHDPDGVAVEFAESNSHTGTVGIVPYTVAHNTAAVEQNLGFYLDVLGLDMQGAVQSPHLVPDVYSPIGGSTGFTGAFFNVRNNASYMFDWLQWTASSEYPTPYKEPNHVGVVRCVLEVDDLNLAHQELEHMSLHSAYHFSVGEPETWDFGPGFGSRKVVNFQDPEGVGFQLLEQRKVVPSLHPYGRGAESK